MIETVEASYKATKAVYDRGNDSLGGCIAVVGECLDALQATKYRHFGNFAGSTAYSVADLDGNISRPFRPDLYIKSRVDYESAAQHITTKINLDQIIYTSMTAFSLCYDLWRPKSRKTPGTFFEVLMGSLARQLFPDCVISKHIPVHTDDASVSTDLVISNLSANRNAVVPLKITTRERISQPFVQQRILDGIHPGRYQSFVACVSEVQRCDKTLTVKQVCVPGAVTNYQKYVARVSGLYYCDPPVRYLADDLRPTITVAPISGIIQDITNYLNG